MLTIERYVTEVKKAMMDNNPSEFFKTLHMMGVLENTYPELDRLFGKEQNPKHHPEGCVGTHTILALAEARKMTDDFDVLFAVVNHDLGKGLEKYVGQGHYHNHEKEGVELVERVCNRFKIGGQTKWLAAKVCENHLKFHRFFEMTPGKMVSLLEELRAFHGTVMFEKFAMACIADANGRGESMKKFDMTNLDKIREIIKICKTVNGATFVEKGYKGIAVKNMILQERIRLVKNFLKQVKD